MHHLFGKWDLLEDRLKGKYLFIFLDYDGTLAPIAKDPGSAVTAEGTRRALDGLSASPCCKVAVISGRSLEDLKGKLTLKDIIYSGNHGLEIESREVSYIKPVPAAYRKTLERIKDELQKKIAVFKGAFIEDKGVSLSLHFRLVKAKQIPLLKTAFHETIILPLVSGKITVKAGKKVLEVRPILKWDKGKAVLWLLARQKVFMKNREVLPLYIGDDSTDEDAFKVLEDVGITIFVGRPGSSCAHYYLRNPGEVSELLDRILKLQEEDAACRT